MEGLLSLLLFAALFFLMMRFGCGSHIVYGGHGGVSHVASCHTALVGGYVVERHVPVAAIRKLFWEKPSIVGISAPSMLQNSLSIGEVKKGTLTI